MVRNYSVSRSAIVLILLFASLPVYGQVPSEEPTYHPPSYAEGFQFVVLPIEPPLIFVLVVAMFLFFGMLYTSYVKHEKAKVKTSGYQWTTINYGCYFIRGSVVNNSHHATRYWKVQCHFYDKNGNEIDSATTASADILLPGAQKRFEIIHPQIPEAKNLFVEVIEVTLIGLDSR